MTSPKPPPAPRRPPPGPPIKATIPAPPDYGPRPFGGDEGRYSQRLPTFDDAPSEAQTGNTSAIVGEWRLLLQAFDELDDIGKAELCQVAHCILRAHVKRKNAADKP